MDNKQEIQGSKSKLQNKKRKPETKGVIF